MSTTNNALDIMKKHLAEAESSLRKALTLSDTSEIHIAGRPVSPMILDVQRGLSGLVNDTFDSDALEARSGPFSKKKEDASV